MRKIKALALFSGGLDSILATRLVMSQGIDVTAIQFVTPFFNYRILADREAHRKRMYKLYGIHVDLFDISSEYLELLKNPVHGFGKNFNPCIDCKIFMLSKAKEMMDERGAKFLITGEVLGQRPMSQRRDTLNVIERDSGTRSFLLRPLSAKLMVETEAEKKGWVDREKLLDFSGRGRSRQISLAKEYGIADFPAPAGGCILADPILSRRISQLYSDDSPCLLPKSQLKMCDCCWSADSFSCPVVDGWFSAGMNGTMTDWKHLLEKMTRSCGWNSDLVRQPC
ncbi:hypothetical protein DGMP_06810 [Desulfomarina profundi]|uniref:Thil AANH domain-containing protein n=1 Tax=Desulfomarina profundi TaxID=2772557 RepID=A0A8D5JCS0_9BACT|nr:hypothetical protein [Desulfomarina profundi]BCL59988.1 hypothetical protein DGMP_06810 [Desulfomarina profundi]